MPLVIGDFAMTRHLRSCYTVGGVSLGRAVSRRGSLGCYLLPWGGEADGLGPTLPALAVGLCHDLLPLPTLLLLVLWSCTGRRGRSTGAASALALPSQGASTLCFALQLQCHLTGTFTLFMSSTLVLFLFHFPFVFSAVLSLVLCLGLPHIPLFVLSMSLVHLCLLLLLYSPCVFFRLRSLSFIISFDFFHFCFFSLLIFPV